MFFSLHFDDKALTLLRGDVLKMAKTKTPFFSMGAHGTVGRSITAQKRASSTLLRRKPLPTDPKSDAQLAQRQVYRDAVTAWHALSLEEQQAWRGVCPGLTAYQCFLRTELKPAPPPPPPEEFTEEQTLQDTGYALYGGTVRKQGQKLTIPDRRVSKLAFYVKKFGSPTGNVHYAIQRTSDDGVIIDEVVCTADQIGTELEWKEHEWSTPQTINEEVRIYAYVEGGDSGNGVEFRRQNSNVKADELCVVAWATAWNDYALYDDTYRYKYYLP